MYFSLPKSYERQPLNKKSSNSSILSTESCVMAEDRLSEIIHNLDDHWGSPPILTPNTLSHILNHQWITNDQEDVPKVAVSIVNKNTSTSDNNTKVISTLIEEFCKVIEGSNNTSLAKDIKNDPIIQKFISPNNSELQDDIKDAYVMQHLAELLQSHNKKKE